MPEVLEPPAHSTGKKGFFTSENAHKYAVQGNIARWTKPKSLPQPPPEPQRLPVPDERLALVQRQIELTRDTLEDEGLEAKDRAQLVRALCGLLDRERILRGEPLPGSLKPTTTHTREVRPAPPTLPAPAPPGPPRPPGWEYDPPPAVAAVLHDPPASPVTEQTPGSPTVV